ncbi:MAG: DUF4058 family protein [Planctomycetota bacterium]|nr:DUF4058 family protein [Planctomycetota bacterium]
MPLHDWARVPDNVFHNFHVAWLAQLAGALNASVLPPGYLARAEEYVGPFQADVLTLEAGAPRTQPASGPAREPTATIAPPRFDVTRQRRITVFSARDERRVAVLEVVSPGNKDSARRARWFEEKLVDCLAAGLHLLLVDLLAPTAAAPGFAEAVARELGSDQVPPGGRAATSFECQPAPPVVRVYHQSFAPGAPLPPAPLFLEPGRAVEVPLEETYAAAFGWLPAADRERLT